MTTNQNYCPQTLLFMTQSKNYDDSNELLIGKMNDETSGVVIEEFVGLKPNTYSFLIGGSSDNKKAKWLIEMLLGQWTIKNIKMHCPIIIGWDNQWI